MRAILLTCIFISASGCSMLTREPPYPWSEEKLPCADTKNAIKNCGKEDVLKAYTLARAYCHELAAKYEDGGDLINSSTFAIAGVGTLAGAVFSPLAEGGAKTAWSGLSGSANALQTALNTSFSNAINARRRDEIGKSGVAYKDQIARESDATKQVQAAMDMAYDCKMAVGRADAAVVKAISELQAGAGSAQESSSASLKPTETKAEAEKKAEEAAKPAAKTATEITIAPALSKTDVAVVRKIREQVAEAAAEAAAPVAAATATTTAQEAATIVGEAPSLIQTQAAARVAAQVAAEPIARAAAEEKATALLSGKSTEIQKAVMDATAPAAAAAAQAAADAAAGTAAAPAQPVSSN